LWRFIEKKQADIAQQFTSKYTTKLLRKDFKDGHTTENAAPNLHTKYRA